MGNVQSIDDQFPLGHLDPKSGRFDVNKIVTDALLAELEEEVSRAVYARFGLV